MKTEEKLHLYSFSQEYILFVIAQMLFMDVFLSYMHNWFWPNIFILFVVSVKISTWCKEHWTSNETLLWSKLWELATTQYIYNKYYHII